MPDANLGIVMSASRTRRQMIQRMGRILRRKQPGVAARFVIMFAKDTLEDPSQRVERDGFLDEIERISDATGVFDGSRFAALDTFLAAPGPDAVPEPEHLDHSAACDGGCDGRRSRRRGRLRAPRVRAPRSHRPATRACTRATRRAVPAPVADAPYLEIALAEVPEIATPKVQPKRFSTGQAPLEIARIGSEWRISCTGCGEASRLVQYRWQVLDETVPCRCD